MKPSVLFLVGPTGSGKSELATMIAKSIGGEIISCDSMLVYRGMNIGTAKPSRSERQGIRHHCIDLVNPRQKFSVNQFRKAALKAIGEIIKRGQVPILVGGSGLYVRSVTDGVAPQPFNTMSARRKLYEQARKKGHQYLYQRLQRIDSVRANEILPNDLRRIIRALEIFDSFKIKPSQWRKSAQSLSDLGYSWRMFGLERDRNELYERINQRVDQMIEKGFVREVKRLKRKGLSQTSKQAIGYAEILSFLGNKVSLEDAVLKIKQRTRHLAKKQLTWFRGESRIRWILVKKNEQLKKAKQTILDDWNNAC